MQQPVPSSPSIFRREAFEHHARGRISGDLVSTSPRWVNVAFWGVLALFITGLAYTATVTISRRAVGPAAVDENGRRVIALLPSRFVSDIRRDMRLTFVLNGEATELKIASVGEVVDPADVAATLPETPRLLGPSVAVTAEVGDASLDPGAAGRAEVHLESQRLLFVVVPGLQELFEPDDG